MKLHDAGEAPVLLAGGGLVGLSTALAIFGGALVIPQVQDFVVHNPWIATGITGAAALFGGLQKSVSQVLPVAPQLTTQPPAQPIV